MRPLSAAIRPTASGNPVNITDSVEWPLQGLALYGKSTQITTTGAQLFDKSAVTPNQWLTDAGKVEGAWGYSNSDYIPVSPGTYAGTRKGSARTAFYNTEKVFVRYLPWNGGSLTVNEGEAFVRLTILTGSEDKYIDNLMFNEGSAAKPWEPYTGGKPSPSQEYPQPIVSAGDTGSIVLTISDGVDRSQSLTLSTPNGLPGIPVDSGGNYTDAEGQQWVCDEVDFARGVYVQRLFSTVGQNVSSYDDNYGRRQVQFDLPHQGKNTGGLSNRFIYQDVQSPGYFSADGTTPRLYVRFEPDIPLEQIDQILQNSVFIYELAAPIETPLSGGEIAAYRALHTYDGTTVVSTAEDVAGLEVRYVANAQKYIDDRLAAAESHIQEIAAAQLNAQTGG